MRPRPPPVAALALCFGLGCAATLSGALPPRALLPAALLLLPILPFLRPGSRGRIDASLVVAIVVAVLAGSLRAGVWQVRAGADCRLRIPDGWTGEVTGRFVAAARGGAVPFRMESGPGSGRGSDDSRCRGVVRAYLDQDAHVRPGARVRAHGTWRLLPRRAWTTAETAGYLNLESIREGEKSNEAGSQRGATEEGWLSGSVLKARGRVQERLQRLFGPVAPVTEALVLARKEGLDPELRDRFARAGIAHLLAISGFHVGIVAGMLLLLGRMVGAGPRGSPLLAATGAWGYVLAIGSPDAAVRAAILLALLAVGPLRSRPLAPLGALATAFLGFLVVDPGALTRVGFQLSFAGTAALILWSRGAARGAEALAAVGMRETRGAWARVTGRRRGAGVRNPARTSGAVTGAGADREAALTGAPELRQLRGLWAGIGAGVAATLGTLPLVAWHFGQVPLLGIPATLVLGPLVALAIPGIFATLALDVLMPPVAGFLAGGVALLLEGVIGGAGWVASLQGDAGWVSRWHVLFAGGSAGVGWGVSRVFLGRATGRIRWTVVTAAGTAGLLLAPVVGAPGTAGTLQIVAIDVGQGDALAIRSPRGRWILVDTGPRSRDFDAGARRVLPYLRRAGVGRLEALILTHPDLDHIGGAPAVLRGVEVGGVLDPGRVAAKAPFEDVLVAAEEKGVAWWPATSHPSLELDGVEIRVLHPPVAGVEDGQGATGGGAAPPGVGSGIAGSPGTGIVGPPLEDANDGSVVLLVTWGRFRALLTGDAPAGVEEEAARRVSGPVQLLKVGHHGSLTSTSRRFLEAIRPEAAIISVGFRNRYGHPHPEVMDRLSGAGARLLRTDRDGTVVIRARDDGTWSVGRPDVPDRSDGDSVTGEPAAP